MSDLVDNFNQIGNKFVVFNDATTTNEFGMHQSEVHTFRDALFRKRLNLKPIMYGAQLSITDILKNTGTVEIENDKENAELKKQLKRLNYRVQHLIKMLHDEEAKNA